MRLGRQEPSLLGAIPIAHLEDVARDARFLPELARRLGDPLFTRGVEFRNQQSLLGFIRRPTPFLLAVLNNLEAASRAALGLVHLLSEERRVGKECVSTCKTQWAPDIKK